MVGAVDRIDNNPKSIQEQKKIRNPIKDREEKKLKQTAESSKLSPFPHVATKSKRRNSLRHAAMEQPARSNSWEK